MKLITRLYKRHTKNFSKYLLVGIFFMLFNVFFMWLFIDIFKIPTFFGAAIVVTGLFISKFYAYRLINLIHKQFLKYASASISLAIANIILMWFFVDIINIPTVISSITIVCGLFILRFFAFDRVGLIKNELKK